jgi:hypothetical protein
VKIRFGQSSCGIVFRLRDAFFGILAFKSRQAKIGWKSLSQNQLPSSNRESDTPRGAGGLVSGAASKAVVPLVEASR